MMDVKIPAEDTAVITVRYSPKTKKLTFEDNEEVDISTAAKEDLNNYYGIKHIEGETKTYQKRKPRKREKEKDEHEPNIDELVKIIEDDFKDTKKKTVDILRKILGTHQHYHRLRVDSLYKSKSHGKWSDKPATWPQEIQFIDPNNGVITVDGKEKRPGKDILENMYKTFKSIYMDVNLPRTADVKPVKDELSSDSDPESDSGKWNEELLNKLYELKRDSFDIDVELEQLIKLFHQHDHLPGFIYAVTTLVSSVNGEIKQENWGDFKQECQTILKKNWSKTTKKRKAASDSFSPSESKQLNIEPRGDIQGCDDMAAEFQSRPVSVIDLVDPVAYKVNTYYNEDGGMNTACQPTCISQEYYNMFPEAGNNSEVDIEGNSAVDSLFLDLPQLITDDVEYMKSMLPFTADLNELNGVDMLH